MERKKLKKITIHRFLLGLNMFLVSIKLETSKFSLYLILIGFLAPTKKKLLLILVPVATKFV